MLYGTVRARGWGDARRARQAGTGVTDARATPGTGAAAQAGRPPGRRLLQAAGLDVGRRQGDEALRAEGQRLGARRRPALPPLPRRLRQRAAMDTQGAGRALARPATRPASPRGNWRGAAPA